eukprot:TRINITY_DN20733_c0_g1_i2.p1 TRINITY_DN20733_c0_g1~~TRINITY_DN20733_c0_g1_i2.p1  ORF type:complete len:314 (+),score=41.22 TRINITY_DN20733_c0_g1_i2:68-1009(+)
MLKPHHRRIHKFFFNCRFLSRIPHTEFAGRCGGRARDSEGGEKELSSPLKIVKMNLKRSVTAVLTPQEKAQEVLVIRPVKELKASPRKMLDDTCEAVTKKESKEKKSQATSTKQSHINARPTSFIKRWQPMKVLSLYIGPGFMENRSCTKDKYKTISKKKLSLNLTKYKAKGCIRIKPKDKVSVGIHFTPTRLNQFSCKNKYPALIPRNKLLIKGQGKVKSRLNNRCEVYSSPLLKAIRPKTAGYIKRISNKFSRTRNNLTRTAYNYHTNECDELNDLSNNLSATMLDAGNESFTNKIYFDETPFRINATFCA